MECGKAKVLIFEGEEEMADFALQRWQEIFLESLRMKGRFSVILSGGRTPAGLYRKLAARGEKSSWRRTHIFFADERFVPFSHRDSNYGMVKRLLLDEAGIPSGNRHPVPVEDVSPAGSAERYEADIRRFFGLSAGEMPEFDLVLLGMGEDGHTASLFPGDPALREERRLAVAVVLNDERRDRITLTLPVLNNARHVIFLLSGKRKARTLKKVMEDRDVSLPAALVRPRKGSLLFLADREAAACLTEKKAEGTH